MGAGVLHPGEQQHAEQQAHAAKAGQGGRFPAPESEPQAQTDEDEVQQADTEGLQVKLPGKAAAVVVGIAVCIAVVQDAAHHGPQQGRHGGQGQQAEQHEIAHLQQSFALSARFAGFEAAHQHQHGVGKIIADHKI